MTVTFNQCPSCQSMILPDTPVCPNCKHVFQSESELNKVKENAPISGQDTDTEDECACCGEMVRSGLVRCWNCGNFMKPEIAEAYREMKTRPSEVIYSPVKEDSEEEYFNNNVEEEIDGNELAIDEEGFEVADEVYKTLPPDAIPSQPAPAAPPEPAAEQPQPETPPQAEAAPVPEPAQVEPSEQTAEPRATTPPAEGSDEKDIPHSEATAGEALLEMAIEEQKEIGIQRMTLPPGMFMVFCPNGHRIKVMEKHRGKQGKCPMCKSTFHVPLDEKPEKSEEENKAEEEEKEPEIRVTGLYSHWMEDICRHQVDPARLKLRAGSLTKQFNEVDVCFSKDGMLLSTLVKPGSLFGSAAKKKPEVRESLHDALIAKKSLDKLPNHSHQFFGKENLAEMKIVQPTLPDQDSLLHDIQVFGEGRIGIQLPKTGETTDLDFLSFSLSQFRFFVEALRAVCGIPNIYEGDEIPMANEYETFDCYYNDSTVPALNDTLYYKADETFEFVTTGYQCSNCGLVMSTAGREAAAFGGAKGKSIAKTKCPGCDQKFGSLVLEALKDDPILEQPEEEES